MIGLDAGKAFAYVTGVYLGDGCVTIRRVVGETPKPTFRLNTIDEDFARTTAAALRLLSTYKVTIGSHAVSRSSKPNWYLCLGDRALCARLVGDTEKKRIIPEDVFGWPRDLKLAFIAGLMDSEGYVGRNVTPAGSRKFTLGYRSCDPWFHDFIRLLQSVGILIGKIGADTLPSGKVARRFSIKLHSWVKSGAYFNIARKQRRIEEWAAKATPETNTPNIPLG